jgi:chromosome segregation ATPase
MMGMTLEQLEEYAARVSTSIGWEYSTIQSYQRMQDTIDTSILQSQSTIAGFDVEIAENTTLMKAAETRKKQLDTDISGLDIVIAENISSISGFDTEIQNADMTIVSLEKESAQLGQDIEAADTAFVSSATYYSTLVYDYLGKELSYMQQVSSIEAESTFLAAAILEETASQATYDAAVSTFTQISQEADALTQRETEIKAALAQYDADERQANANVESTIIAINTLSTIYETSVNVQKYYQAVAAQTAAIDTYTTNLATYNQVVRDLELNPNDQRLQLAKAIATQILNTAVANKDKANAQVAQLQSVVNIAQSKSYEAILKGHQDTIDMETRNMNSFAAKRAAAEAEIIRHSTLFEEAERDIKVYEQNITTYTEQYNSSIKGAETLTIAAQADEATLKTQQDTVNRLEIEMATYARQYEEYTSSYTGYMAVSSMMKKAYDDADVELATFSTLYESTVTALDRLTTEEEQLVSTITMNDAILKTQSSFYERELVKQEAFQAMLAASLTAQELAAMQYRETYVRTKKLYVQELYNAQMLIEVQTISTQNGQARAALAPGAAFVPRAVDLNTPTLLNTQTSVNTIQAFLNTFDGIYKAYDTQITTLNTMSTFIDEKKVALERAILYNEDPVKYEQTYPTPSGPRVLVNPIDRLKPAAASVADLNAAQAKINTQAGYLTQTATSIKTMIDTFSKTYEAIFAPDERIAHISTISSFLEAGYKSVA